MPSGRVVGAVELGAGAGVGAGAPTNSLAVENRANVLEQDEQVIWVGGRRDEVKPFVEPTRSVALGVHGQRTDDRNREILLRLPSFVSAWRDCKSSSTNV